MSKVNHRGNGKKYRHGFTYRTNGIKWSRFGERRGSIEVTIDGGTVIPECDIKFVRRIQRRRERNGFNHIVVELTEVINSGLV